MTTFNLAGQNGGSTGLSSRDNTRNPTLVDALIDFSSTTVPNSGFPAFTPNATTLSGNASGDIVQVFTLPAAAGTATSVPYNYSSSITATFGSGVIVHYASFEVLVADTAGNTGTLAVGDSGSSTRWTSAITVQTTGLKAITSTTPILYTSANDVRLTIGTGAINAIVRVYALITDITAINYNLWY